MASLKELLPAAKSATSTFYDHTSDPWFKNRYSATEAEKSAVIRANPVPPYLKRAGFRPSKLEDFGDGGAFLKSIMHSIHLIWAKKDWKPGGKNLPVTVDEHGEVRYDAIVRQGENAKKIVYSQHKDLIPKFVKDDEDDEEMDLDEKQKVIDETTEETKAALEKIVNVRLSAAQPKNVPTQSQESKFIKYKPSQQAAAFNSGAKERIIRMVEMPVDPLDHQSSNTRGSLGPLVLHPVPVMHSPPRPVTVKDQQDWKIPPCISKLEEPQRDYTIPLDKRLAADGGGFRCQINDNFAKTFQRLCMLRNRKPEKRLQCGQRFRKR
ncbi:hypothetical protein HAX54_053490 [Datura stramonium]|uniref:SKI-interacting protein SKIP SNW domain-containing protein n=1 Tax=Datura stramonium TaxID=4076 RepID=A0ABS8T1K5_DATST|nr:hypothetical protein [Datura stramonium]